VPLRGALAVSGLRSADPPRKNAAPAGAAAAVATPRRDSETMGTMDARKGKHSPVTGGEATVDEPHSSGTPRLPFTVAGVGASAGGIEAMSQLLAALPLDTGLAFVMVAHLDPTHESLLAEILGRATRMPVEQVRDGMAVLPNHVYVIPPNAALTLARGVLRLTPRSEPRGTPRAIDEFLGSLAGEQGFASIGVILSGTAHDGTLGLAEIKAAGGITFAQDASALHDSMPRSAEAAGCVDFVLPPAQIAAEIARIGRQAGNTPADGAALEAATGLGHVLALLRERKDVDFACYRRSTLARRIARRVLLHRLAGLDEYVAYLLQNPAEVDALHQDILISVTSFFRNPEAFEAVTTRIFPQLTEGRPPGEAVRMWVLGCSTGEEAYSLAIAFTEHAEALGRPVTLQLFATDLNEVAVERARAGVYPRSIAGDVSPARLRRFFAKVNGGYRIAKSIRDRCIFARHDALVAPPFSNLDLVSCRNLLIYLEPPMQQRLLGLLHYALKPSGYLWLGGSETAGALRGLFEAEDAHHKIYARRPGRAQLAAGGVPGVAPGHASARAPLATRPLAAVIERSDPQREADRLLLARFAPPGVLVDRDLDVLQFRGDTGPFLSPAAGKPSLNLLRMLREGLLMPVRTALQKARADGTAVRQEGLGVRGQDGDRDVAIEVIPLETGPQREPVFLVLFEESTPAALQRAQLRALAETARSAVSRPAGGDDEVARLQAELTATREDLQALIEQQEAANEELQSANEEIQSANEELQSINEELETSKEEIQSANEELATVNDELNNRNAELALTNNDLVNLVSSVQVAIVMLGPDLRIRRFTPVAEKQLGLLAADVGRAITDIRLPLPLPDLGPLLADVIDTVSVKELEVQDGDGRWFALRLRPYRTIDNRIDGAVLMLVDIDAIKRNQELRRREELLQNQHDLLDHSYDPILIYALPTGIISYWNHGAEETYGYTRDEALGQVVFRLLATSPDPRTFLGPLETKGGWTGELVHTRRDGTVIDVESRMVRIADSVGQAVVVETNRDITRRKRVEADLRRRTDDLIEADRRRNEFLGLLAHELRNPLAALRNSVEILKAPDSDPALMETTRNIIDRQVHKMARLINDLLDVVRVTRNHINLQRESLDLAAFARRAVDAAQMRCGRRRQTLELRAPEGEVPVLADPIRIEQILDNLLDNACKFTQEGGHIRVTVGVEPAGDTAAQAVLRVHDDGIGIDPTMAGRIFDLFVQADSSTVRAVEGLGIGLSLVRRLVELHGGGVEVQSRGLGLGSEFIVRLPLAEAPVAARAAPSAARTPHLRRRILVVDDNADAAESLAQLLRRAGHDVRVTHDARAAVDLALEFQPEVGVLDLAMPGVDGFQLAKQLRERWVGGPLHLIATTGYGGLEDRRRARDAGFDDHLTKPIALEHLLRLVERRSASG
jgi:two-component system, chemotaxis family, CheB/CheR fusion protein